MNMFSDVVLEWDGRRYTIPASKMMRAIAVVEQHLTLKELHDMTAKRQTLGLATISMAYGALLRFAGADVADEQIYQGMFSGSDASANAMAAVQGLLGMMMPPAALQNNVVKSTGKSQPAAARSSRQRSGRRSAPSA